MSTQSVPNALRQVQIIQQYFLEKNRFAGYSGNARTLCGIIVICAAYYLARLGSGQSPEYHLACWLIVAFLSFAINIGAVLMWFQRQPAEVRNWSRLAPVWFVLPPIFIGAVLTYALVLKGQYNLLFGMWMVMYGLTHFYASHAVPLVAHRLLTGFYIIAGCYCLVNPAIRFVNPMPMGMVFFVGEIIGGIVFVINRQSDSVLLRYLKGGDVK